MKRNRIPIKYFISQGSGQSDLARHAGSYHIALWEAGIDGYNFVPYSSVLHKKSVRVYLPEEIEKLKPEHGSEMMCIQAVANGTSGDTISAGIVYAELLNPDGSIYGGIVCEETGVCDGYTLGVLLVAILKDMYGSTYKTKGIILGEPRLIVESQLVTKKYGTSIVSINFLTYK